MNKPLICCFGEVLWDIFPTYRKMGGAPLNVALRLHKMGLDVRMISAIGKDELGKELINLLDKYELDKSFIQYNDHGTGTVDVLLNKAGNASYKIAYPVAWDKISTSNILNDLIIKCDSLIYGSLIIRDETSRDTLFQLLLGAKFKVLDINLRPPHYTTDSLIKLIKMSDMIKCNEEELEIITSLLGLKGITIQDQILSMSKDLQIQKICVTRGHKGAVLLWNGRFYEHTGYKVRVKDTVGAGDSFLAALVGKILLGEKEQHALAYACAMGALVASKEGANPEVLEEELLHLLK